MASINQSSVPAESQKLFEKGIWKNPLMPDLPSELASPSKQYSARGI
jgi:hypothetical protein